MPKLPFTSLAAACCLALRMTTPAALADDAFTRGDCNADGSLLGGTRCEITDGIFLLHYLFLGGRVPPCFEACNVNGSPTLDVADAVYLFSFCFSGGPRPPAPFPGCGPDPTGSSLGCREFRPCRSEAIPVEAYPFGRLRGGEIREWIGRERSEMEEESSRRSSC